MRDERKMQKIERGRQRAEGRKQRAAGHSGLLPFRFGRNRVSKSERLVVVVGLRQLELAGARPTLDLAFALHGVTPGGQTFAVDQTQGAACASVAGAVSFFVRVKAPSDIVRPAGINRTIGAEDKVDKGGAFPRLERSHVGLKIRSCWSMPCGIRREWMGVEPTRADSTPRNGFEDRGAHRDSTTPSTQLI